MVMRLWSVCFLIGLLAIGEACAAQSRGYFLVFEFDGTQVRAPSVMATDEFVAARGKEAAGDWSLRVLDANGNQLFATPLQYPLKRSRAHGAETEPLLVARIPDLVAAARIQMVDSDGTARYEQSFDENVRHSARARAQEIAASAPEPISASSAKTGAGDTAKLPFAQRTSEQIEISKALKALDSDASAAERDAAERLLRKIGDRRYLQHTAQEARAKAKAKNVTAAGPLRTLSGKVRSAAGQPLSDVTIRARRSDSGAYVLSTRSDPDGNYEMLIGNGSYVFEVTSGPREYLSNDNRLYIAEAFNEVVVIAGNLQRDITLTQAERTLTLAVRWEGGINSVAEVRVKRGDTTLARPRLGLWDSAACTPTRVCTATWTLRVSPGLYDFDLEIMNSGIARHSVTQIDLRAADQRIDVVARPTVAPWNARVYHADGTPFAGATIISYDGLGRYRYFAQSDEQGRFQAWLGEGWVAEIGATGSANSTGKRFEVSSMANLPSVVRLESPGIAPVPNGSLTRIFTGAESDRVRILYLGEGYTDRPESFTDSNGNGVWDGILWYDINGNGTYEADDDFLEVYGNATVPAEGTRPNVAANEPFNDLSGEGFPNFDDRALLLRNAQDHLRSLFGMDYWNRNTHRFQADVAFLASPQSGMTVTTKTGTVVARANTLFNTRMSMQREIIELDRTRAMQRAEQLMPGYDELIILVNQPVVAGRATQTIGIAPGSMVTNAGYYGVNLDDPVSAHEMGHFIGDLGDEYSEMWTTIDEGDHYPTPNVSLDFNYAAVPWRAWLNPGSYPHLVPTEGIGVFEGADYVQGGAYRPTWNSMMRYGPLFNAPSRAALDQGFSRFIVTHANAPESGNWYDRQRSGHGFDLQLVRRDGVNGDIYQIVFYTYTSNGVPEWYVAHARYRDGKLETAPDANGNTLTRIRYDATRPPGQRQSPDPSVSGQIGFDFSNVTECRTQDRAGAAVLAKVTWRINSESGVWCIEPLAISSQMHTGNNRSGHWYSPGDGGWGFEALTLPGSDAAGRPRLILYLYYPTADGNVRWATASTNAYSPGDTLTLLEAVNGYCRTCTPPQSATGRSIGTIRLSLTQALREEPASGANSATIQINGGGTVTFSRVDAKLTQLSQPPGT
jgi:hypothetical protein